MFQQEICLLNWALEEDKNTYYKKHKRPESLEGRQQQEKEHNRELTKSQMFSILPTIQIRQVKGVWVTQ